MVLVSAMIFSKKFLKNYIEDFKEQFQVSSDVNESEFREKGHLTVSAFIFLLFIVVINVLPAVIISLHCASKDTSFTRYLYPIVAFLFSDVYMLAFVIRKFILKDNSFCNSIIVKN